MNHSAVQRLSSRLRERFTWIDSFAAVDFAEFVGETLEEDLGLVIIDPATIVGEHRAVVVTAEGVDFEVVGDSVPTLDGEVWVYVSTLIGLDSLRPSRGRRLLAAQAARRRR